jgi:hypothetical protein
MAEFRESTTWELWSYDVWGNATDGYDVNDRSCFDRSYEMSLKRETFNAGKPGEFIGAYPSDYQIKKAFGIGCAIETDGDDLTIYITRKSDGYPLGEMFCTSHDSLSPVRVKTATTV